MGKRRARLVILCEDRQHRTFVECFAERRFGKRFREIRVVPDRGRRGSGEQFVREQLPDELRAHDMSTVASVLVVVTDADGRDRMGELRRECEERGQPWARPEDGVLVLVPARSIETWLEYLRSGTADEAMAYPHLEQERKCRPLVDRLAKMCAAETLTGSPPASLESACESFRSFEEAVRQVLST